MGITAVQNKIQNNIVVDRKMLKWIAIVTMFLDHLGTVFFPEIRVFKWIGRIAFPIFVYQLVEGFEKTSNIKKYFCRLTLFAFISEVPFDLAFFGTAFNFDHQNVYFELIFCLLALVVFKEVKDSSWIIRWVSVYSVCLMAILMRADYSAFGVLLAILFYQFDNKFLLCTIGTAVLSVFFTNTEQLFCLLAFPLLWIYKTQKTTPFYRCSKPMQLFFYAFYPLHIILIYAAKVMLLR